MSITEMSPKSIAESPNVDEDLQLLESGITERLNPGIVQDSAGFQRQELTVSDGVTIVFKEMEELPEFEDTDSVTICVTDAIKPNDEKPKNAQQPQRLLQTSGDDYDEWLVKTTNGSGWQDPFEQAIENGYDVRFLIT